jgi:hypothetical protein
VFLHLWTFTPLKILNGTPLGVQSRTSMATLPINELKKAGIYDACPILNLHRCKLPPYGTYHISAEGRNVDTQANYQRQSGITEVAIDDYLRSSVFQIESHVTHKYKYFMLSSSYRM